MSDLDGDWGWGNPFRHVIVLPVIAPETLEKWQLPRDFQVYQLMKTYHFMPMSSTKETDSNGSIVSSWPWHEHPDKKYVAEDDIIERNGTHWTGFTNRYYVKFRETDKIYRRQSLDFAFETPRSVLQILAMLIEIDPQRENSYMRALSAVMKGLSPAQEHLLETTYKPYVYDSFDRIPDTMPRFALRNVRMHKWCSGDEHNCIADTPHMKVCIGKVPSKGTFQDKDDLSIPHQQKIRKKIRTLSERKHVSKRKGYLMNERAKHKQTLATLQRETHQHTIQEGK